MSYLSQTGKRKNENSPYQWQFHRCNFPHHSGSQGKYEEQGPCQVNISTSSSHCSLTCLVAIISIGQRAGSVGFYLPCHHYQIHFGGGSTSQHSLIASLHIHNVISYIRKQKRDREREKNGKKKKVKS